MTACLLMWPSPRPHCGEVRKPLRRHAERAQPDVQQVHCNWGATEIRPRPTPSASQSLVRVVLKRKASWCPNAQKLALRARAGGKSAGFWRLCGDRLRVRRRCSDCASYPPGRRFVLEQVTQLLAAQRIELSTDELRYNVLDLSLSLRNIRVRSPEAPNAPPFAIIPSARVDLSLMQLLRGRYVVESGVLDGVNIHYFVDERGNDNVPRPPAGPRSNQASRSTTSLPARGEQRAGAIREPRSDHRSDAAGVVADRRGQPPHGSARGSCEGAAGHLRVQDRTTTLQRLSGEFDLGKDDIDVTRLDVDAAGSRLSLSGSVRQFDAPVADLTVRARIDVAHVAPLAGVKDPVGGAVEIDATVKGPVSGPALDARVSGSELRFRNVDRMQLAATAAYDMKERRADVSALQLRAPWGALSG